MKHNHRKKWWFFLVPIVILFGVTAIVMLLWNAILPEIAGVKTISYWQAMGILVLSKILFGGFHGKCGNGKFGHFKQKMMEHKMSGMTDEEKEKLKEKLKEKFGNHPFCSK